MLVQKIIAAEMRKEKNDLLITNRSEEIKNRLINGEVTLNEARREFGLKPIPGELADVYMVTKE